MIQIQAVEKPFKKWYYRFESKGILFPTYFEHYYTIEGITPMNFVMDENLGPVELQTLHKDEFLAFDTEHHCVDTFLLEQWDRGHYMQLWDLSKEYHRELFNIFMEKYAHSIMAKPEEKSHSFYIEMDKELQKY